MVSRIVVCKGTRQDLAIAHDVVIDKHDGSIHFESEEAKDTTFIIRLHDDDKSHYARAVVS